MVDSAAILAPESTVSLKTAGSHPDKAFAGRRPASAANSRCQPDELTAAPASIAGWLGRL